MHKIVCLLILTISAGAYQYESPCQDAVGGAYRPWRGPPVAGYAPCSPGVYNPYLYPPRDYSLLSSLILRPIAHLSNTIFGTASDMLFRTRSGAESGEQDNERGTRDGIDFSEEMNSKMDEYSTMEMDNPLSEERFAENNFPEAVEERSSFPDPRFKSEEEDLQSAAAETAFDPTALF